MPRSEAADEQQVEPNPRISSTGGGPAASGRTDAGFSPAPGPALPWPCSCGGGATAKPARATPRTRAMASTTASGATGRRRVTPDRRRGRLGAAGAGRGAAGGLRAAAGLTAADGLRAAACGPGAGLRDRVSGLVSEVVTPYQARALTNPVRPATGMAQPAGTRLISNAAADRARNSATSQAAARSGGSVRHHQLAALPWLSSRPYSTSTGSTPRNGHENGSRATPKASATSGDSRSTRQVVSAALDPSSSPARGRASARGQASQARTASSALRAATTASRVSTKRGQVPPNPNSQRRSW